jgi:hypothetical protein
MKGYSRPEEMTDKLTNELTDMLNKFPSVRLGQLIVNVLTDFEGDYFSHSLFNIHDEDLLKRLKDADVRWSL